MKIFILHEKLEWTEERPRLPSVLEKNGCDVSLISLEAAETNQDFKEALNDIVAAKPDVLVNRIYASVSNRRQGFVENALDLFEEAEREGIVVINSAEASRSDYSKLYAFKKMANAHIATPKTLSFSNVASVDSCLEELKGFPVVVKPEFGGRSVDVMKCNTTQEVLDTYNRIKSRSLENKVIMQEFITPIESRDYRLCVMNNTVVYCHGRSLMPRGSSKDAWIASFAAGSQLIPFEKTIDPELVELGVAATQSISADFNVMDVIKSEKGYVVIENNLTPSFDPGYKEALGFDPIEYMGNAIVKIALQKYSPK